MGVDKNYYKFMISGDSISRGVIYDEQKGKYAVLAENYVSLLQTHLTGAVYNISKFGATITKGVTKLNQAFNKNTADVVVIEYGGNDCDFDWLKIAQNPNDMHLPKTDINTFEQLLKDTLDFLKSKKSIPVLLTLPPLNADAYFKWVSNNNPLAESNILQWLGSITKIYWWQERYNAAIIKVAQETETKWIDIRGAFLQHTDFTKLLCKDGIHPNKEGHAMIANKILTYVKQYHSPLLLSSDS